MTVADVVEALGGSAVAARLFGVGTSAVSNWRTWDEFPKRLHLRVLRECEARGIVLPTDFFDRPSKRQPEGAAA